MATGNISVKLRGAGCVLGGRSRYQGGGPHPCWIVLHELPVASGRARALRWLGGAFRCRRAVVPGFMSLFSGVGSLHHFVTSFSPLRETPRLQVGRKEPTD